MCFATRLFCILFIAAGLPPFGYLDKCTHAACVGKCAHAACGVPGEKTHG